MGCTFLRTGLSSSTRSDPCSCPFERLALDRDGIAGRADHQELASPVARDAPSPGYFRPVRAERALVLDRTIIIGTAALARLSEGNHTALPAADQACVE